MDTNLIHSNNHCKFLLSRIAAKQNSELVTDSEPVAIRPSSGKKFKRSTTREVSRRHFKKPEDNDMSG